MSVMNSYVAKVKEDKEPAGADDFTMEQVRLCMNALLAFGGSPTAASRVIEETYALKVGPDTLRRWRDGKHAELYAGLQEEHGAAIEQVMVREMRDLARMATHAQRLAIEKVIEAMSQPGTPRLNPDQVSTAMAKVTDTNVNKLLALTGRPQAITESRSASELMRSLESKGVLKLSSDTPE